MKSWWRGGIGRGAAALLLSVGKIKNYRANDW
jgi:hypothetical protein